MSSSVRTPPEERRHPYRTSAEPPAPRSRWSAEAVEEATFIAILLFEFACATARVVIAVVGHEALRLEPALAGLVALVTAYAIAAALRGFRGTLGRRD
jgi:hypothetical protein